MHSKQLRTKTRLVDLDNNEAIDRPTMNMADRQISQEKLEPPNSNPYNQSTKLNTAENLSQKSSKEHRKKKKRKQHSKTEPAQQLHNQNLERSQMNLMNNADNTDFRSCSPTNQIHDQHMRDQQIRDLQMRDQQIRDQQMRDGPTRDGRQSVFGQIPQLGNIPQFESRIAKEESYVSVRPSKADVRLQPIQQYNKSAKSRHKNPTGASTSQYNSEFSIYSFGKKTSVDAMDVVETPSLLHAPEKLAPVQRSKSRNSNILGIEDALGMDLKLNKISTDQPIGKINWRTRNQGDDLGKYSKYKDGFL